MARVTRSRDDFVVAAVEVVTEFGWEALDAKFLAERMGVHGTAVYRHFPTWDSLIGSVFDSTMSSLLGETLSQIPDSSTPAQKILAFMRGTRNAVDANPILVKAMWSLLSSESVFPAPNIDAASGWLVEQLALMGVPQGFIPIAHQSVESLLIGGILVDYAAQPSHVSNRRQRRRMSGIPAFEQFTRSDEECEQMTTAAFEFGAHAILVACEITAEAGETKA